MLLAFGTDTVQILEWETQGEMLDYLHRCNLGNLLLNEETEGKSKFYSVSVNFNDNSSNRFCIGISSAYYQTVPHLLMLPSTNTLLFGYNSSVYAVELVTKSVFFSIELDSLFRSFINTDNQEIILLCHEIGVVAITENGGVLWKYSKDIITDISVKNETVNLCFMDYPSVSLNILDGSSY